MADKLDPRKYDTFKIILHECMKVGLTIFGMVLIAIDFHHLTDAATAKDCGAFILHLIIEFVYGGMCFFSWKYWFKK